MKRRTNCSANAVIITSLFLEFEFIHSVTDLDVDCSANRLRTESVVGAAKAAFINAKKTHLVAGESTINYRS